MALRHSLSTRGIWLIEATDTFHALVADDHPLMADALASALRSSNPAASVDLVYDRAGLEDALDTKRPDLLLLDLQLGSDSALEILNAMRSPAPATLIVSAFVDATVVIAALNRGAAGFLSKSAPATDLTDAVTAILRGDAFVDPSVAPAVWASLRPADAAKEDEAPALSPRERAALTLAASGRTEEQIAAELHLSRSSVKTYMRRSYEKLGVSDKTAAVAQALRRGLIE